MNTTEFPVLKMRDCSGGMISAVDDELIPDNAAKLSLNFRHNIVGRATQRDGYTQLGATVALATPALGLTHFVNAAGTTNCLVAAFGASNYAYNGSTWTDIGAGMDGVSKVRYASFLDRVFRVGGGTSTATWDGNTANTFGTTQVVGAPSGSLITIFKNKVYIAGNSSTPDRVFFSSVPDTSLNITWDSTDWLDVNPSDGDDLTAFARTGTLLLFFKKNFIYRWNGTSTDAEPIINVGTVSQETVATVNGTVIFFNPSGIYMTDGSAPVEISRPIDDWIKAIPATNYSTLCAYADDDFYGLFCGTVVKDGRTYTNLVLEYDTHIKTWQAHYTADNFRFFTKATASDGTGYIAGATSAGKVHTMFSGTTDNGAAINFERQTRDMDFDGRYSTKELTDYAYYLSNNQGAKFEAIVNGTQKVDLGSVNGPVTIASSKITRGNWISFKISGSNKTTPVEWRGFDILKGRSLGLIKK